MRNLKSIHYDAWRPPADQVDAESPTACCWDPAKDEVLAAFGPSEKDGFIRLVRLSEHVTSAKQEHSKMYVTYHSLHQRGILDTLSNPTSTFADDETLVNTIRSHHGRPSVQTRTSKWTAS